MNQEPKAGIESGTKKRSGRPRGTGSVFLRGDIWWVKYSRNGKAFAESSRSTSRRQAERLLAQRLAELRTGTFLGPKVERVTVSELAADFLAEQRVQGRKSLDSVEARWRLHLAPALGHLRAVDINGPVLNRYLEARLAQGAENATINRELAALRRMFTIGRINGKVPQPPPVPSSPRRQYAQRISGGWRFPPAGRGHGALVPCSGRVWPLFRLA